MSTLKEEFQKINDYTISVINKTEEPKDDGVIKKRTVIKTFNFLSCRLSENFETCLYEGRGTRSGGSAGISSNVFIDNFKNLPSYEEVKLMHKKLIELGGTPPELHNILPIMNKKPTNI